jgi:hypothetical protein
MTQNPRAAWGFPHLQPPPPLHPGKEKGEGEGEGGGEGDKPRRRSARRRTPPSPPSGGASPSLRTYTYTSAAARCSTTSPRPRRPATAPRPSPTSPVSDRRRLPVLPLAASVLPCPADEPSVAPAGPSYPILMQEPDAPPCFLQPPSPSRHCTVSRAQSTGTPLTAQPRRSPGVPGPARVHAHPSREAESCPCLVTLDRRLSPNLFTPHRRVAALDREVLASASSSPVNGKRPCPCPCPSEGALPRDACRAMILPCAVTTPARP